MVAEAFDERLFYLQRFLDYHDQRAFYGGASYLTAVQELKNGRKISHWIWYVFPQLDLRCFRLSHVARSCSISGKSEALAYIRHPILGKRYKGGVVSALDSCRRESLQRNSRNSWITDRR